jgi:hypothetical protein
VGVEGGVGTVGLPAVLGALELFEDVFVFAAVNFLHPLDCNEIIIGIS